MGHNGCDGSQASGPWAIGSGYRFNIPLVCNYSLLVYNLQLFAKTVFCLAYVFWIPFVLYFFMMFKIVKKFQKALRSSMSYLR